MFQITPIEIAIEEIRQGRMLILVDDDNREQEGDLIFAAEKATAEAVNFMTQYARGIICLTLPEKTINDLRIPLMPVRNKSINQAAFATSIEAAHGVVTGASVQDRAHTIRVAVNPHSTFDDITMPGHVFPLQARPGGVLERPGHTEGSIDLVQLAGLQPGAVICEILKKDGSMARLPDLIEFGAQHNIKIASINDLINYRLRHETVVEEIASSPLTLNQPANFKIKVFRQLYHEAEHVALISENRNLNEPCMVRIHSECFTGDVLGSGQCDCGWQLQRAIDMISIDGGILLYMRQEGRGIGLSNKIKAYDLQSRGLDTVEANHQLGFSADLRHYGISAQILRAIGVKQIRLMTNNPKKVQDMALFGIDVVERVQHEMPPTDKTQQYLNTKLTKLGHLLQLSSNQKIK